MEKLMTKYGELTGISYIETYEDGSIKGCVLRERNEIKTNYGTMVPQYTNDEERRKNIMSLKFHQRGTLRSIALQDQVRIDTNLGTFPAELITFYESEKIKSIFPLNGRLTGYWTEEKEYALAEEFTFKLPLVTFTKKIISIKFYEKRAVKSITFWPLDVVDIETPVGIITVRIGLELYPSGQIKSVEPNEPTIIDTPIGKILAYDHNALGIHGDTNSIKLDEKGSIKSIATSTDQIKLIDKEGNSKIYKPDLIPNWCNESIMQPVPMVIEFEDNIVRFNRNSEDEYDINRYEFKIRTIYDEISGCASCSACG